MENKLADRYYNHVKNRLGTVKLTHKLNNGRHMEKLSAEDRFIQTVEAIASCQLCETILEEFDKIREEIENE